MCIAAAGLIGGLVSAVGTIASAQAQAASFSAQAKVAERQAELERDKGAVEIARTREASQRLSGKQIAAFGSSGVTLAGSAQDVIADSITEANLDIGAIRFGRDVNVQNFQTQAKIARVNASQARTAGFIGALTPLINSFGQGSGTFLTGAFA